MADACSCPDQAEVLVSECSPKDPDQESSVVAPAFLGAKLAFIDRALDAYCEAPTAAAFMQIYTCVYDLCNGREQKDLVCRAVYEVHCKETQQCLQQLATSCQILTAGATTSLQDASSRVLPEWLRLERRFHILQASFSYLDRYYVPRANIDPLATFRSSALQASPVPSLAQTMWSVLAASLGDGDVVISFGRMREIADAWNSLAFVLGLEDESVASCAGHTLRAHLASTFTEGRQPLGRPSTELGTATDRVLGTQRPLVRLILDFLSEEDLCQVYSLQGAQKSK